MTTTAATPLSRVGDLVPIYRQNERGRDRRVSKASKQSMSPNAPGSILAGGFLHTPRHCYCGTAASYRDRCLPGPASQGNVSFHAFAESLGESRRSSSNVTCVQELLQWNLYAPQTHKTEARSAGNGVSAAVLKRTKPRIGCPYDVLLGSAPVPRLPGPI